jgi:hypothetical protein
MCQWESSKEKQGEKPCNKSTTKNKQTKKDDL